MSIVPQEAQLGRIYRAAYGGYYMFFIIPTDREWYSLLVQDSSEKILKRLIGYGYFFQLKGEINPLLYDSDPNKLSVPCTMGIELTPTSLTSIEAMASPDQKKQLEQIKNKLRQEGWIFDSKDKIFIKN